MAKRPPRGSKRGSEEKPVKSARRRSAPAGRENGDRGSYPIVAIGASAGGIEALESFFRNMPSETGMAFVVILHLDPKRESVLGPVISRWTDMQVLVAKDGEPITPNKVYVIAPNAIMSVSGRNLQVRRRANPAEIHPIDVFFSSLAQDQGEHAICIVLSGTGTDGSIGLKSVKERGGLTLAQGGDGTEARFKEMPVNAAATGMVDLILPVQDMPARLIDFVGRQPELHAQEIAATERQSNTLRTLYTLLRTRVGHDFSRYKERTFLRRVQRRM